MVRTAHRPPRRQVWAAHIFRGPGPAPSAQRPGPEPTGDQIAPAPGRRAPRRRRRRAVAPVASSLSAEEKSRLNMGRRRSSEPAAAGDHHRAAAATKTMWVEHHHGGEAPRPAPRDPSSGQPRPLVAAQDSRKRNRCSAMVMGPASDRRMVRISSTARLAIPASGPPRPARGRRRRGRTRSTSATVAMMTSTNRANRRPITRTSSAAESQAGAAHRAQQRPQHRGVDDPRRRRSGSRCRPGPPAPTTGHQRRGLGRVWASLAASACELAQAGPAIRPDREAGGDVGGQHHRRPGQDGDRRSAGDPEASKAASVAEKLMGPGLAAGPARR